LLHLNFSFGLDFNCHAADFSFGLDFNRREADLIKKFKPNRPAVPHIGPLLTRLPSLFSGGGGVRH
jgi:hypothetical protein